MKDSRRSAAGENPVKDRRVTRRDVLRMTAAGVAAGVTGGATVGTVAAAGDYPHLDVQEHVSVTTDPAQIEPWQPRLTWDQYPEQEPLSYACMRLSSPEYDDDCIVGFHEYAYQKGVSSADSHDGDHEPIYVFFDPDSGDVTNVSFSGYHWFRASAGPSSIRLVDSGAGQQPVLRVVDPWHHHLPISPEAERDGRLFDVSDLDASISAWLANGMSDDLRVDQPFLPWRMRHAADWWRDTTLHTVEKTLQSVWVRFGIGDVPDRGETGWDR